MNEEPPLLTTSEVAELLGVKPATVYAYVSRGLLGSRRNADGKGSLFERAEVDIFLASRKRPTTPGIQTGITLIKDGALYYRGRDAVQLARVAAFEEVATLLWTGERQYVEFTPDETVRKLAEAVIAPLPHTARHTDRLRVIVAAAAAGDPLRFDTSPASVIATGRSLIATMVAALPAARRIDDHGQDGPRFLEARVTADGHTPGDLRVAGDPRATANLQATADRRSTGDPGPTADPRATTNPRPTTDLQATEDLRATGAPRANGSPRATMDLPAAGHPHSAGSGRRVGRTRLAEVLWSRLSPKEPAPRDHNLLDAALILLADHDIAASTLAARVAASTRAHPYAVVGAGLAALDGPLHGAASSLAHALLAEAITRPDPMSTIADRLRSGDVIPGFGHRLYPSGDPRAPVLLDLLGDTRARDTAQRLADVMRTRSGVHPNVDLALAAISVEHDMPPDAGETIFAVARTAGWLAHALEEYGDRPLRFRPSGEYAGRTPT